MCLIPLSIIHFRITMHHHGRSLNCCFSFNMCSRRGSEAGGQATADDVDEFDDEETFLNLDDVLQGKQCCCAYHACTVTRPLKAALRQAMLWSNNPLARLKPCFPCACTCLQMQSVHCCDSCVDGAEGNGIDMEEGAVTEHETASRAPTVLLALEDIGMQLP
jgi:hypothetical protein